MRYAIESSLPTHSDFIRRYVVDTANYSISDESGEIDFSSLARAYRIQDFPTKKSFAFSPKNPLIGKAKTLFKLRIQLGLACNYNCTYCLQSKLRHEALKAPKNEAIDALLKKIDQSGVRLDPSAYIEIWGGEPLVYWDSARYLAQRLREIYGWKRHLALYTNGVLLNDEIVNTLLKFRIKITISHDGPGQALRNPDDPLKNPEICARWKRYIRQFREAEIPLSIFSVLTPKNCDLKALRQFFVDRLDKNIHVGFGGVASESENLPDTCLFTESDAAKLRLSVFDALVTEPENWPGLHRRVANLMTRFIKRIPSSSIRSHCNSAEPTFLNVDVYGNILSCQNRPASHAGIGSIEDVVGICKDKFTHWTLRPHCSDCLVLGSCKGACPDLSDGAFVRCCTNEYAFHSAIFYTAWWFLTGTLIRRVYAL